MNRQKVKKSKVSVEDFNTIKYKLHTTKNVTLVCEVYLRDGIADYYIKKSGEVINRFTGLTNAVDTYNDIVEDL